MWVSSYNRCGPMRGSLVLGWQTPSIPPSLTDIWLQQQQQQEAPQGRHLPPCLKEGDITTKTFSGQVKWWFPWGYLHLLCSPDRGDTRFRGISSRLFFKLLTKTWREHMTWMLLFYSDVRATTSYCNGANKGEECERERFFTRIDLGICSHCKFWRDGRK